MISECPRRSNTLHSKLLCHNSLLQGHRQNSIFWTPPLCLHLFFHLKFFSPTSSLQILLTLTCSNSTSPPPSLLCLLLASYTLSLSLALHFHRLSYAGFRPQIKWHSNEWLLTSPAYQNHRLFVFCFLAFTIWNYPARCFHLVTYRLSTSLSRIGARLLRHVHIPSLSYVKRGNAVNKYLPEIRMTL